MRKKADMHDTELKISPSLWQRMRRTPYQSIAAVFMITITLFVLSIFLISAALSSSIISYFESKPQITIFFKENQSKDAIDLLIAQLKATGKISSIEFISKDQALRIYQEQNKDDPLLLEMVTADILPESLEVSAINPSYLSEVADMVRQQQGVDEVVFQKDVIDTLISWTSAVRKFGIVFIIFLFTASLIILITTIGMKIAYRRQEIEIMKLIGATPWYIKRPFIAEGMYYGLIGGFISWIFSSAIVLYIQPFMSSFLKGIPTLSLWNMYITINLWPPNIFLFMLLWITLSVGGVLIGLIGSLFATSRYMKY